MSLLLVFLSILLLVVLITWAKWNPFLAFLVASIVAGYLLGIPIGQLTQSVKKGIGDMLGELVIIICLGAMMGKMVAESGAAEKIAELLLEKFGARYFQWAMMVTGFIVGIPLFYNVGFVLMIPLVFSVVYRTKLPAVYVGIPLMAALSVTHGFLPPHPSPTALVAQFHASLGLTLVYGIAIAIPTIIIAGPLFGRTLKKIRSTPLSTFTPSSVPPEQLPGGWNSFLSALLPVLLLLATTAMNYTLPAETIYGKLNRFLSDPLIVMLLSLLIITYTLGKRSGRSMQSLMQSYADAIKDVAQVLLIVAGAGALKQVFIDSGVSGSIGKILEAVAVDPLILGWLIAALIRVCLGSATVAGLTAAGILAPVMAANAGINPNLMVLSIGAGSLMFSHVNDSGFWMFKEYFNLSVKDTLRSWSLMETIVAVCGLGGVLLLQQFIT